MIVVSAVRLTFHKKKHERVDDAEESMIGAFNSQAVQSEGGLSLFLGRDSSRASATRSTTPPAITLSHPTR